MGNSNPITSAIAAGGLDALKQMRDQQAQQRGAYRDAATGLITDPTSAYGRISTDNTPTQSAAYDSWRAGQGFQPTDYSVAYGRTTGGKYGGFRSVGDLKAATLGQAENFRQNDQLQAEALRQMAAQRLDTAQGQYSTQNKLAVQGLSTNTRGGAALQGNSTGVYDNYHKALNAWLGDTASKLMGAQDLATHVQQTPIQDYGTKAAAVYGVDPNLARGWYNDARNVSDFNTQRNNQSIQQYGAPYSEVQSAIARINGQQAAADKANVKGNDAQAWNDLSTVAGMDAKALGTAAKLTQDQMKAVLGSQEYQDGNSAMQQAVQNQDGAAVKSNIAAAFKTDPWLGMVMQAQYGWASA